MCGSSGLVPTLQLAMVQQTWSEDLRTRSNDQILLFRKAMPATLNLLGK